MREQILSAMKLTYNLCVSLKAGGIIIPPEDLELLNKYEKLGVIKLTMPKPVFSDDLYYPTIQAKEFTNLSQNLWVDVILWATKATGITGCNLTINSAACYRNSPQEYKFIEPVITTAKAIGTVARAKEKELFTELKEEF